MTSLPMVGCSTFLLRLPGKLGHESYRAVLMVQPVLRSNMKQSLWTGDFSNRL